jgi:hypothetical protein
MSERRRAINTKSLRRNTKHCAGMAKHGGLDFRVVDLEASEAVRHSTTPSIRGVKWKLGYARIACEACGFDFGVHYGNRGDGFIECHHTKPIATLAEGQKTHIDDLALVCANSPSPVHRRTQSLHPSGKRTWYVSSCPGAL